MKRIMQREKGILLLFCHELYRKEPYICDMVNKFKNLSFFKFTSLLVLNSSCKLVFITCFENEQSKSSNKIFILLLFIIFF